MGPNIINGKSVLVTGGAGAFGQAFVRFALQEGAGRVVVFSRDEAKHAAMRHTLQDDRVRYFVGDVRDAARITMACRHVDLVVHAAAMKRVDTCEADPNEAIATNILGSRNVAQAAITNRVECAVLLSTDKAAAPCTLYGMTKAVAERAWVQSNAYADGLGVRLVVTRYGNVLGSTGSVLPIWAAAEARGEPLSLSDPTATRFWMDMAAAVRLVDRALCFATRGETFIPKISGSTVSRLLAALYPGSPYTVTGLRAGEKLHETLISADERARTYDCDTHYVIAPAAPTWSLPLRPDPPVADDFTYVSSDPAHWDSLYHLRSRVAP